MKTEKLGSDRLERGEIIKVFDISSNHSKMMAYGHRVEDREALLHGYQVDTLRSWRFLKVYRKMTIEFDSNYALIEKLKRSQTTK